MIADWHICSNRQSNIYVYGKKCSTKQVEVGPDGKISTERDEKESNDTGDETIAY